MKLLGLILLFLVFACNQKSYRIDNTSYMLDNLKFDTTSTTAGNLVATAIKEVNELDVVFYPSALLNKDKVAFLNGKVEINPISVDEILSIYPDEGPLDQFMLGTMNGASIKDFIKSRVQLGYSTDLQVAGIEYNGNFVGGLGTVTFNRREAPQLVDKEFYRVAISNFFFFSGATFPSYQYGDNLDYAFKDTGKMVSARIALQQYLATIKEFPNMGELRAKVTNIVRGDAGKLPIFTIQSDRHRSPYYGQKVTTSGIVTAVGSIEWYPGGVDIYIQDEAGDNNLQTSDAIHLYFPEEMTDLQMGDKIEVTGIVYEQMANNGLSKTSIRQISLVNVLSKNNPLPPPINLGINGQAIPNKNVSTYHGDLNIKPFLNLADGIDFYESLEGMRVEINSPRIVGFRGGKEEMEAKKPKGYLSLYVLPDGNQSNPYSTANGGLVIDMKQNDFNPEIMMITTNHLTRGLQTNMVFNIGDLIEGPVVGIMSYEKNIFGDGEYTLVLPEDQNIASKLKSNKKGIVKLEDRPKTTLVSDANQLTIATYNAENLAGNQGTRLDYVATLISTNLKCPDIVNLVEVQDLNGVIFDGDPSAIETLNRIIKRITCPEVNYKAVDIAPMPHSEGGEPGGNIRVAQLYNANKLQFNPLGHSTALDETLVLENGSINRNPGRVFPNDPVFQGTRKSLVVEYKFKGEKLFIIGNHLNSKLSDSSLWGNIQPVVLTSDYERTQLAGKINTFARLLTLKGPKSNIIILGDFNAYYQENSMKVLEGDILQNLIWLLPQNDRYTTIYNGSSQAIDFIFANANMLEKNPEINIPHINTDYMARISDHDPVLAKFQF